MAVHHKASPDADRLDRPEPPVIGDYLSVYFPHSDWETPFDKYCTDVQSPPDNGVVWQFNTETNMNDQLTLQFEGLESVPVEFEVWLVDNALKSKTNLRTKPMYSFDTLGSDKPKRFRVFVGKPDFVQDQTDTFSQLPTTFELSQNFPNPFNPSTILQYGLPNPDRVTFKIYDILGRLVVTLLDNELKDAGYHAILWNSTDDGGNKVASGVYFLRMQTKTFAQTRKMLLIH